MSWTIREERPADAPTLRALVGRAFEGHAHADGTEPGIVERLHADRTPVLSLVAVDANDAIIGQVAFSPVTISDGSAGWYGLGPLSVAPERQGAGIGSALAEEGLKRLRADGAAGCVVLGEPAYYARFGFRNEPLLQFPGVPAHYFQCLAFAGSTPAGTVSFAPAFG